MSAINIKLKVISKPEPNSRTVFEFSGDDTVVWKGSEGQDAVNYICGKCSSVIAENVKKNSIKNIVVKCNSCDSYNEFV